jgi:hypothetical protein
MHHAHCRWASFTRNSGAALATLAATLPCLAQAPEIQFDTLYDCAGGNSFKVFSCTGTTNADACEVQSYANGQPRERGQAPRLQVMMLVPMCRAQSAGAQPGPSSSATAPSASTEVTGAGGFKAGDTVRVITAGGWYEANVVRVRGNSYLVRLGGVEVWKAYPDELRRIGPLTDEDRSHGLYDLHDKVQVNFEGRWVESEVIGEMGKEYNVTLPGNRTAWATAANMRLVAPKAAAPVKAGVPPKPGFTSCAGKVEGRYASAGGAGPMVSIVFRSGKASMPAMNGGDDEYECWTGDGKIWLHKPGDAHELDVPIDMNDDGTLDTPFGEIKKKGK